MPQLPHTLWCIALATLRVCWIKDERINIRGSQKMFQQSVRTQAVTCRQNIFLVVFTAIYCCHLAEQPQVIDGMRDMHFSKAQIARDLGCSKQLSRVEWLLDEGTGSHRQVRVFNANHDIVEVAEEIADAAERV